MHDDESQLFAISNPSADEADEDDFHERKNGVLQHLAMPSVQCRRCERIVSFRDLKLAYEFPHSRELELVTLSAKQPLTWATYNRFASSVLREIDVTSLVLHPGVGFANAVWQKIEPPQGDFFWPFGCDAIVSDRAKNAMETAGITGVDFLSLGLYTGFGSPQWSDFHEMVVRSRLRQRRGAECKTCRRPLEQLDSTSTFRVAESLPTMPDIYEIGADLVVSDRFAAIVEDLQLGNVLLERHPGSDSVFPSQETEWCISGVLAT